MLDLKLNIAMKVFLFVAALLGSLVAVLAKDDLTDFGVGVRLVITLSFALVIVGLVLR
jgi:hypothetical protein